MRKRKLFLICCCLYAGNLAAQILHVAPGTDFTVKSGTDLYLDSLVVKPSSDFVLNGNTLTRDAFITYPSLTSVYISRVYHFSNNTAPFNGSVQFYYQDGAQLNGLAESDLRLHIHDGIMWNRYNSNFVNDPTNNYVLTTSVGNISLNELTLASSSSVLPLKWLSVLALRNAATVNINWSAIQDVNSAFFIIERSIDSRQWFTVGSPVAAIQEPGTKRYAITDFDYDARIIYYRIKQVDKNGSYTYSSVAKVPAENSHAQISIYPNPSVNQFHISYAGDVGIKEVQLLDLNGSILLSWKALQSSYNLGHLPAGTYSVRLLCADGSKKTLPLTKL